jgi:hypothetical protein
MAVNGYMTLVEMAALIGITPAGLRMQIRRGSLTAIKRGRDWFVADEEAARYIREQAGKKGTASPRHPRTGNRTPRKRKPPTEPDGGA